MGLHWPAHSVLLLLLALFAVAELSEASSVVDVFRMIQYDLGGVPLGARRSSFSLYAAHNSSSMSIEDLARSIVVMQLHSIDFSLITDVVQNSKLVGGILILLPKKLGLRPGETASPAAKGARSADTLQLLTSLRRLEEILTSASVPAPVYFAESEPSLLDMLRQVQKGEAEGKPASATNGGLKLVVSQTEGRVIKTPPLVNLNAWLVGQPGTPTKGEGGAPSALPTIVVVAPYDTFGVAPALSKGAGSNGSGVTVLLELLRLFSRLYARTSSLPPANLLFALTSGGPFDYDGTKQWLKQLGQQTLGNIDFALCLNNVGGPSVEDSQGGDSGFNKPLSLYLHTSKPLKNPRVQRLLKSLESGGGEVPGGVTVEAVHKKINISSPRVPWEHEAFSREKVFAATLSTLPNAPSAYFTHTGGPSDSRLTVHDDAVLATVKTVAETLASYLFSAEEASQLEGRDAEGNSPSDAEQGDRSKGADSIEFFSSGSSMAPSSTFISHWLDFLSEHPRAAPFLTAESPVVAALQEELSKWAHRVERTQGALNPYFTVYSGPTGKMYIHEVASVSLDLILLPLVAFYLALLYVLLHIATKGLDDFIGLFRASPHRKSKVA